MLNILFYKYGNWTVFTIYIKKKPTTNIIVVFVNKQIYSLIYYIRVEYVPYNVVSHVPIWSTSHCCETITIHSLLEVETGKSVLAWLSICVSVDPHKYVKHTNFIVLVDLRKYVMVHI